ncbi:MAG: SpoIIE family protein phosphatase, partial [Bacteroidota bacterium]
SAFEPIRDSSGNVVAVLMVDREFNVFLRLAATNLARDVGISLGILLLIGLFLFRFLRLVIKNEEEQKAELRMTNQMVLAKNKAIQDSINYAKRIQDALIPDESVIRNRFKDSYVFFRGKDVVSGDFPWMFRLESKNEILLATVDCTGHGVPGALLSIIGYFLLNDIIKSKGITQPSRILDELHKGVVTSLNQEEDENGGNDGMDVALVKIDINTNKVEFAGAHRPLVWVHEGQVQEIKGDRLAIGGTQYQRKLDKVEFTNHELQMKAGDAIHFFSDGFPDQIGGPNKRRLMNKTLRNFFMEVHGKPMKQVGQELEELFENWKGTEMQLDDVLVIGIRFT